jgi:hypothetical protein
MFPNIEECRQLGSTDSQALAQFDLELRLALIRVQAKLMAQGAPDRAAMRAYITVLISVAADAAMTAGAATPELDRFLALGAEAFAWALDKRDGAVSVHAPLNAPHRFRRG